jgi:NADH dehydrogenase
MTDPQTITPDHLRALLDADSDTATLALLEGRVEVSDADQGLEVISRSELAGRLGDDPSDEELTRQAATLTAVVQELGG